MKKILIAGAGGYLGTKMVDYFLSQNYEIIAIDRFYFGSTLDEYILNKKVTILKADIRDIPSSLLKGVYAVINLASISNDPAAELEPEITTSINYQGAVSLAVKAKNMKVKKYIFTSSCSVYGASEGVLNEKSSLAPISVYAKSKINAENELLKHADSKFCITILRLSTLFGLSTKRMRFDLIINVMTLYAWKHKKLFIMGGGKQWRPLIHLDDCLEAISIILHEKTLTSINKQIFNIGSNQNNYQVFQVANLVKKHFPDIKIEVAPDDPDKRSYRVSFDKFSKLFDFKTNKSIDDGIIEIKKALESGEINDDIRTNTSWYYKYLMEADTLLNSIKINNKLF